MYNLQYYTTHLQLHYLKVLDHDLAQKAPRFQI